ncbi:angiopoietin-related protein 4-like [Centropristis striata]|uniref:angiopoietin-related protein 4-like n=1 Tax=Centropristis striata TaxID=184440 RepID=UPI0027DFCFE2|nr:angiopoietin-related protein 4-like [Centropristis striata]XP_059197377.1 angiopoietin-related protein 4-like [Centropristis striata]XP_059197378.1 angiopoietin-related protein 4-like [Centropristis striata]
MKMTPQLLILLVTILVHAAAAFPSDRRAVAGRDKHASWDDVNVVAHGLLQLGQGLKEHVDKSKAQMRDINAQLKAFNSSVAQLERRQQEQDQALQARKVEEVMVKVEEEKMQSEEIQARMDRLEDKVEEALKEQTLDSNDSEHTGVSFIQKLVVAQNRRIDQLVEKIKQQQDKLEKQSLHLQTLQSKVAHKRVKSHRRRDEETALRGEPAEQSRDAAGLARDCSQLFVRGQRASGVYTIQPENSQPFNVYCEMTTEEGWTVIQKRYDGSQSFNQLWESYKRGFGSLNDEFWLGLENIHSLSKQGDYVLQVALSDQAGEQHEASYRFQLDGEEKQFSLHLQQEEEASSPSGLQENIMTSGESGLPFSTADRDNDLSPDVNCAQLLSGGWWFSSCGESNLNGRYQRRQNTLRQQQLRRQSMFWTSSKGQNSSVKRTLLKIAPATMKQRNSP